MLKRLIIFFATLATYEKKGERAIVFMKFFQIALIALLVASCVGEEKALFQEGKAWEAKGEKTKALYFYEQSLRENPDYEPVLKRMGLLLAESPRSVATSLFYLEKYYKTHKDDPEIQRELFRLLLTTGYEKEALHILEEMRFEGKKETVDFFESTYLCLTRNYKQKDYLKLLEISPLAGDPYYAPWVRACEAKI